MSVAMIFAAGHFTASVMAMHPLPVPKSNTRRAELCDAPDSFSIKFGARGARLSESWFKNFQPNSASSSVSGLGTSACRFTAISSPQNEVEPVMCWSGSRRLRLRIISRNASVSAGVSTRSKFRYNFIRGSLSRCASSSSVCRRGDSTPFWARKSVLF